MLVISLCPSIYMDNGLLYNTIPNFMISVSKTKRFYLDPFLNGIMNADKKSRTQNLAGTLFSRT